MATPATAGCPSCTISAHCSGRKGVSTTYRRHTKQQRRKLRRCPGLAPQVTLSKPLWSNLWRVGGREGERERSVRVAGCRVPTPFFTSLNKRQAHARVAQLCLRTVPGGYVNVARMRTGAPTTTDTCSTPLDTPRRRPTGVLVIVVRCLLIVLVLASGVIGIGIAG